MDTFKQGLQKIYDSGKHSDFTIVCGQYNFKVHKAVICTQSEYFDTICSNARFIEGQDGKVTLMTSDEGGDNESCDDPEAVRLMIEFFYRFDYAAEPVPLAYAGHGMSTAFETQRGTRVVKARASVRRGRVAADDTPASDGNMVMHAKVFAAAVKYQVPSLETLAAAKFDEAVKTHWKHDSFAAAAHVVYTTTPEDVTNLREIINSSLLVHQELLQSVLVKTVVSSVDGLAYQLLERHAQNSGTPANVVELGEVCPDCDTSVASYQCDDCKQAMCSCWEDNSCEHCGTVLDWPEI